MVGLRMFAHGQAGPLTEPLPWETWTLRKNWMVRRRPRVLGEDTRPAFVRQTACFRWIEDLRANLFGPECKLFFTFDCAGWATKGSVQGTMTGTVARTAGRL